MFKGRTAGAGRGSAAVLSVFIGECSLDILKLKSSAVLVASRSSDAVESGHGGHMRMSADLFLIRSIFLDTSPVPPVLTLPEEEPPEEQG
jgi:hypothetical protein